MYPLHAFWKCFQIKMHPRNARFHARDSYQQWVIFIGQDLLSGCLGVYVVNRAVKGVSKLVLADVLDGTQGDFYGVRSISAVLKAASGVPVLAEWLCRTADRIDPA